MDNGSTLMYITPPALTIIDDYDPPIRAQGLAILMLLVDRLSVKTLKNTGAFELFMTVSRVILRPNDLDADRHDIAGPSSYNLFVTIVTISHLTRGIHSALPYAPQSNT